MFCCLVFTLAANAELPPDLPGEELTQEYLNWATSDPDTSQQKEDSLFTEHPIRQKFWLDSAMKTWDAPPLSVQQAANQTIIPFGKGGIFIPRFSETNYEPDMEIIDPNGDFVLSGETGRTYTLEPGKYYVILGSGTHKQRIVKQIQVKEGQVEPLIPDWSGLVIEIVDEQGVPIKGEYELARLDVFDPYGRGYGASPDMGETVKTWILKPGIYKIFGVGDGYNTLTNFVTVRLVPGEFTRFLLIQDSDDLSIQGGGTVQLSASTNITPSWRYGSNIGGSVQFSAETDHQRDNSETTFTLGLLSDSWLMYRKKPVEWNTRLRLEEGFNITDWDLPNMISNPDRMILNSMLIWRIFKWIGPYARVEVNSNFLPEKIKRNKENWFCFVDSNNYFRPEEGFDSSRTHKIEPAFSPSITDIGAGVNADLATMRVFEAKARLGVGSSYSRYLDRYRVVEPSKVKYDSDDSLTYQSRVEKSVILYPEDKVDIFEFGPQASISLTLRLGLYASAESELKVFAPIMPENRFDSPDYEFNSTISWRLSRALTLDYTYRTYLKQPKDLDVPVNNSSHGIWLRLHYSSR